MLEVWMFLELDSIQSLLLRYLNFVEFIKWTADSFIVSVANVPTELDPISVLEEIVMRWTQFQLRFDVDAESMNRFVVRADCLA